MAQAKVTDLRQLGAAPLHQWTWPVAADDPRSFTWLADRSTALTTLTTNAASVVLGDYHVAGDHLQVHLRTLPTADPNQVRTLELADGRMVLVHPERRGPPCRGRRRAPGPINGPLRSSPGRLGGELNELESPSH